MKKIILLLVVASLASCNKKPKVDPDPQPNPSPNVLTGEIEKDLTIEGNWTLDKLAFVNSGVTLTIKPGARITANTSDDAIDILVVKQGGKLNAVGTSADPIIFTSAKAEEKARNNQEVSNGDAWGGIVINGYGKINTGDTAIGEYAPTGTYGGSNNDDSSGNLSYVYLKYPGYSFDENKQLNGFSFYAVGSQTVLDHLAVYYGFDDGLEFWGGKAKVTNAFVSHATDDGLDWTDGFAGSIENAVVVLSAKGSDRGSDKGIEADNQELNPSITPMSSPALKNIWIYQEGGADKTAINVRRGTGGSFRDIYVWSVGVAFKIDDDQTKANLDNASLNFTNVNIDSNQSLKLTYAYTGSDSARAAYYSGITSALENNPEIKKGGAVNATSPVPLPVFVADMKSKIGIR